MSRSLRFFAVAGSTLAVATVVLVGCSQPSATPPGDASSTSATATSAGSTPVSSSSVNAASPAAANAEEHAHIPGSHGGIIIPIGSDSYHAEAVIEKDGTFRLLMLGADETRIQEVDIQPVKAYVKAAGESDATPIEMKAIPQDGDVDGKTSQFVGKLPETAIGSAVDVTIPNLRIGGERFRVGFTTAVQQHDSGMPAAVTGTEEQKLYFTPGGKYTQADIEANGKLSAGQKFRGFMSKHDMSPKPGDFICPVTFTKANPKIEWIVDSKKYLFCCPPCVDEFVRMAKEEPGQVKEPQDYVQKEMGSEGAGSEGAGSEGAGSETQLSPDSDSPDSQLDPEIAEALAGLNADDRELAGAQKFCAVMTDSLLGSMGTPIKIDVKGQSVFLCCKGCKTKAMNDPDSTLANVAKLKKDQATTR
ncbi:MAG: hypothetical protein ABI557_01435 [Aureliella sp.]